jgi:formylglycine-generating enzyme required for sulfatase activity
MKRTIILSGTLAAVGLLLSAQGFAEKNSGETQMCALPSIDVIKSAAKADKFVPIEWITIPGGKFMMGSNGSGYAIAPDIKRPVQPLHEVAIKTFQMSKTLVTVEQYGKCVSVGKCTEPNNWNSKQPRRPLYCNWKMKGRESDPINCVDWDQANQYARFVSESQHVHARLPTESEWEYAARSGGKDQKFPWGNEQPTCERAVMSAYGQPSCGRGTMPVCSKPKGNTKQGLCDMAGNVWEWVQDKWHGSYAGGPTDGSAWEEGSMHWGKSWARVVRGGSWGGSWADNGDGMSLRPVFRIFFSQSYRGNGVGFRLAQSAP